MEEFTVETPLGRIVGQESGSGPALICLHGLFVSHESFSPLRARWPASRRLVTFDLPGSGRSRAAPGFVPGWQAYAEAVLAVAEARRLERFDLLGHSMGGGVAASLTLMAPRRVRRLVLVDPVLRPPITPWRGRLPLLPFVGWPLFRLYGRAMFRDYFRTFVFEDPARMDLAQIDRHYDEMAGQRRVAHCALRLVNAGVPGLAARLPSGLDVLLLWGEHDRLVPVAVGRELVRTSETARLEIVPGAGHAPLEELPDQASALVIGFLLENGAGLSD